MHIARGDDLDARDANEMTPLMIAASKNKATICSLLLSAGADHALTDATGRSAVVIAKAAGAAEAAAAIESFLPRATQPSIGGNGALDRPPDRAGRPDDISISTPPPRDDETRGFDLSEWDAEEEPRLAESEDAIAEAAGQFQRALSGHRPSDDSEDWHDVNVLFPDRAAPFRSGAAEERRTRLRILFLMALRDGTMPAHRIMDSCADAEDM